METICRLKEIYDVRTSEELFGLDVQPEDKCTIADKALAEFKNILEESQFAIKEHKYQEDAKLVYESLDNLDRLISWSDLPDEIEKLRSACSDIRQWGQQWKDIAKSLIDKYGEANFYVSEKFNRP